MPVVAWVVWDILSLMVFTQGGPRYSPIIPNLPAPFTPLGATS